jgi:hypothetical protein
VHGNANASNVFDVVLFQRVANQLFTHVLRLLDVEADIQTVFLTAAVTPCDAHGAAVARDDGVV